MEILSITGITITENSEEGNGARFETTVTDGCYRFTGYGELWREIQNVSGWEKWIRTAYELKKARIYITGSSSKLLSGEIATSIGGRYLRIDVYPLTFSEYLGFMGQKCGNLMEYSANSAEINRSFAGFLRYGGFPRIVSVEEDLKKEELISYFNTILLKDIIARYSLRNYNMIKKFTEYMLTNDTKQNSVNSISRALVSMPVKLYPADRTQ